MEHTDDSARDKPLWRRILKLIVLLLFLLGMLALPVLWFINATPGERWGFAVFMLAIAVVGVLSARYKQVETQVQRFFAGYLRFCIWLIVALAPIAVMRWVAEFALSSLPTWLQTLTFIAWGVALAWALKFMATERGREKLFDTLARFGFMAPIIYAVNVLMIADIFFATLSYVFHGKGWVAFTAPAGSEVALWSLLDFYLWHFMDALPALKVNETLRWATPLDYQGAAAGWLLLVFKLTVIIPTIGVFVGYWRRHSKGSG